MAENKFIQRLKGETSGEAVLEVKNQTTPASFGNMPAGTSNPNSVYSDHRGNATAVLNGTDIWTVNDDALALASNVYGDGRDFTTSYLVVGSGAWINATYTFAEPKIFTKNSKWVLKLCGTGLIVDGAQTVDFSLIVKVGASNIFTKQFTVAEDAGTFCKEFVLDFAETNADTIKLAAGDTLTVQLLCGAETATARIYNGMTALTCLQRRVGAEAVASDTDTFEDIAQSVADVEQSVADVEETIAGLGDTYVKKAGDTMTGPLTIKQDVASSTYSYPLLSLCASYNGSSNEISLGASSGGSVLFVSGSIRVGGEVLPSSSGKRIGGPLPSHTWDCVYTKAIYNGYVLNVPQKTGTLATIEDVNAALANAGSSLTSKGVWYAKMYAGTTAPAAEDGTNYADFSQTDGQGNPIIVIYERQNGAWVQTETITPPANYNGYVIVTSKIWDIPEQTGQQGGQVNWDCVHKTFTPYPKIVSFEDAALTGDSTVQMPVSPTNDSITNKAYVDTAIANAVAAVSPWDLFDIKWKDYTFSGTGWTLADGNWKTSATAYAHLLADIDQKTLETETVGGITVSFYRADDGHKICPADQESSVDAIYAAMGVAWYYIIDTVNQRCQLPRTTHGFVGIRTNPGEYVAPELPNIKGFVTNITSKGQPASSGALYSSGFYYNNLDNTGGNDDGNSKINIDASLYDSTYKDNGKVQAPATEMYLYFYIGV